MKKKVLWGTGITVLLFGMFKAWLISTREYYFISDLAWFENGVILIGISVLLGALSQFIVGKINDKYYKQSTFIGFFTAITYGTYWAYYGWLYLVYSKWHEPDMIRAILEGSEIPAIFTMAALATFIASYFICKDKTYIRVLNPKVTEDVEIKREVDRELIGLEKVTENTALLNELRNLRNYEYYNGDRETSLSAFGVQNEFNSETDETYIIRYNSNLAGYFIIKNNDERKVKEITEFYASLNLSKSFQILAEAFYMYFEENKNVSFEVHGLEKISFELATLFQLIVKSYTEANYEVRGKVDEEKNLKYGIYFKS